MATPTSFQAVSPWVAKIAPTTTGIEATRASVFTLSDRLPVRDVSEDFVNPSPASVPTPGQRNQKPQQRRATGEHDLSEPRTRLYTKDGSGQPSAHGAEQTSQPAGLHASAGTT